MLLILFTLTVLIISLLYFALIILLVTKSQTNTDSIAIYSVFGLSSAIMISNFLYWSLLPYLSYHMTPIFGLSSSFWIHNLTHCAEGLVSFFYPHYSLVV